MSKINKLGTYKGVNVQVKKQEVTKEEIDAQMQAIVAQNLMMEEKDGEVALGDVTTIDFEGFKDGVAFDGGKGENYQLEIGSGQFIPGFEEQMIGMKKGETRELNLTFPENYGVANLAGADVVFKVTVHKIENKKETTLDDAFVGSLGIPDVKTVAQLQDNVKASLQAQHDQAYQAEVENTVFETIIQDSEVEVTEVEVKKAMDKQIQQMSMELARQGMVLDQYLQMMGMNEESLRQQLEPSAKQQAIFEAIIDEIISIEKIETTDDEMDQQVEMIASYNQMTKEEVFKKISKDDLKHDFNRMKASRFIIENATITK